MSLDSISIDAADYNNNGYYIAKDFPRTAIDCIRNAILSELNSKGSNAFESWRDFLVNYCKYPDLHCLFSSKPSRLLNKHQLEELLNSGLHTFLSKVFGDYAISDEETIGVAEVYWRIARPYQPSDIGPVHADSWFWELNSWKVPDRQTIRTKIWIPINVEKSKSGLYVIPGSHATKSLSYVASSSCGKAKPINIGNIETESVLLDTPCCTAVVFHDDLLHGGSLNMGKLPRVSFEMTCFHKELKNE